MSASLLIKEPGGGVVGYALVLGNRLCIRIKGQGMKGLAWIGDGQRKDCEQVICSGQEQSFQWDANRKLVWIRVEYEGVTLAAGGEVPENEYCNERIKEEKVNYSPQQKNEGKSEGITTRQWAQRRWPPPPCWPSAFYINGSWGENES